MRGFVAVSALLCMWLAPTLCAQAPEWTTAELSDLHTQAVQMGAPEEMARELVDAAKVAPSGRGTTIGRVVKGADGTTSFLALCVERVIGANHIDASRQKALLRAKSEVMHLAWTAKQGELAFPELAPAPVETKARLGTKSVVKGDRARDGFVVALFGASQSDVALDAATMNNWMRSYTEQLQLLALRADADADGKLLSRVIAEHAARLPIPTWLMPYQMRSRLLVGEARAPIAADARNLAARWEQDGISEARPWAELGSVCGAAGDVQGLAHAMEKVRAALAADSLAKSKGLPDRTKPDPAEARRESK